MRQQAQEIPTIGLSALFATKLTRRGDNAKDLFDVGQLLAALADAGRALDVAAVRSYLRDDPDAIALLAELASGRESSEA